MTLLQQAIGSILRFALAWASGYLVSRGVWTAGEAGAYVEALAPWLAMGLISLGWSLYQKYATRGHASSWTWSRRDH